MRVPDLLLRAGRRLLPTSARLRTGIADLRACLTTLRNLGLQPDTVIDVGAYEGGWTRRVAPIFPRAQFLLLEAQPAKRAAIERNLRRLDRYRLEIAVLGARDGEEVTFYDMETGSSYYPELTPYARTERRVATRTLDGVVGAQPLGQVLLKLDTQGSELDILRGATQLLGQTVAIVIEASLFQYNQSAPTFTDTINFLDQRDFALADVTEMHRRSYDDALIQLDLVFVRRQSALYSLLNDFSRGN